MTKSVLFRTRSTTRAWDLISASGFASQTPCSWNSREGYIRSRDHVPAQLGPDVTGDAFYIESQQYFPSREMTFLERLSVIDLEEGRANSVRKDYTIGAVRKLDTWLRAAVEYTYTEHPVEQVFGHLLLLQMQRSF